MFFEKGFMYHIYNQGNNKRKIFFNDYNYLFFLEKIKTYVLPYADIFAYCLMPNHFHLMIYIRETELDINSLGDSNCSRGSNSLGDSESPSELLNLGQKKRTINDSIAIMLRSYTRAINKQEGFSGSLFRNKTKAECINCIQDIKPSYITKDGITKISVDNPGKGYPQICFNYIHQNPVKAGLVNIATKWEFSSAKDYSDLKNKSFVNKELCQELVFTG